MSYNINFNIAAIINLIIVLFAYAVHKKLPEQKNKMFLCLCIATFCSTVVDIVCILEFSKIINVSHFVMWVMNILYYFCVCSIPFIFELYVLALTEEFECLRKLSWKIIYFLPVILEAVLILITPVFHFVFEINEAGEYVRKTGLSIIYGLMLIQILTGFGVIWYFKQKTSTANKIYITSFVLFTLIGVAIQILFPKLLFQHFAISVSLLFVYTSLQSIEVITDSVTGLYNLKTFNLMMNDHFKHHQNFTVVSVSLDDIQFMTSTFGIEATEIILAQVAEFLSSLSPKYTVYQIEQNLFAIVIPDATSLEYSRVTASITRRFARSWKNDLVEIKTSVRQCVIRCPADATNTEEIIDTINSSRSDNRYKNERLLFAENIDVNTRKRYSYIEQLVKSAIHEHRIMVMYQPIYSTTEKRIIGAEALVRMKDMNGNFISPDEFIPIAEQNGNILRIGLYVYEEVCRFLATKHLKKLGVKMIDVNLSVSQCMQMRICEEFKTILDTYNLDPSLINLEITETASALTPELLYSNMDTFKDMGFSCSLDDYGTGYANLSYMLHMPFNMVKIDKEIIWSAIKDEKAYVMLVGIIDMMHKLNLRTVAEGIETQEMVDTLTDLKCDFLQGFYYSRAVPEDEFLKMLEDQADRLGTEMYSEVEEELNLDDVEELELADEISGN